jgi:2-amino-4-hydroxy-6-hydroxymethyldihydropteridine diphosphokinase
VYIGLGANVGNAATTLSLATSALHLAVVEKTATRFGLRRSRWYESAPVGPVAEQAWFVNGVVELQLDPGAGLTPRDLLDLLLSVERRFGRDRARETPQGPRRLDLDLLLWGDAVIDEPGLVLPHPRMAKRAFVLAPLIELTGPDHVIPGAGRVGELLAAASADPAQIVRPIG